jgi:hypothetical protein
MTHPTEVGTAAALSPALAVNYARPTYDPLDLATSLSTFPRLYLGAGVDDWARTQTERLARSLESTPAEFRLDITPGGHDEVTWDALLPLALDFIAESWEETPGTVGDWPVEIR